MDILPALHSALLEQPDTHHYWNPCLQLNFADASDAIIDDSARRVPPKRSWRDGGMIKFTLASL